MKVLLVNPYYPEDVRREEDWNGLCPGSKVVPEHMLQIAAEIRKVHDLKVIDCLITKTTVDDINMHNFDVVISMASYKLKLEYELAYLEKAKESGAITILVLNDAYAGGLVMNEHHFIDILMREEKEFVIEELLDAIEKERDLKNIKGILFRRNGQIISTPKYVTIDFSKLQFPAYDLIDMKKYTFSPVRSAKGCPFKCTFCHQGALHGNQAKFVPMEKIIKTLSYINEYKNIKRVLLLNEDFAVNDQYVHDLSEQIINNDINLKLTTSLRAYMLKNETLYTFRKAGFDLLHLGLESANDFILKKIKKGINKSMIERGLKKLKKFNFIIHASMIVGFPWDSRETLLEMEQFLNEFFPRYIQNFGVNFLVPEPGTEIYTTMREMKLINGPLRGGQRGSFLFLKPNAKTLYLSKDELARLREQIIRNVRYNPKKRLQVFLKQQTNDVQFKISDALNIYEQYKLHKSEV